MMKGVTGKHVLDTPFSQPASLGSSGAGSDRGTPPRNNPAQEPRSDIVNHLFKHLLLLHREPTEISQQT